MILIYCSKLSSRIKYTFGLFFEGLLGVEYKITHDSDEYFNYRGGRVNYSKSPFPVEEFYIEPSGFLNQQGINNFRPQIQFREGFPLIFPAGGTQCNMGFDPFSAAFYLVSRYEEYLPFKKDSFGRFEARESFAYQNGFLNKPVVNQYALLLKDALKRKFPFLEFPELHFSFFPSYDIDVAFAYKGRGLLRTLLGSFRSLSKLDFRKFSERFQVIAGTKTDPYDTYDYQLTLHKKYDLKAYYFFLSGEYGPMDKNVSFFSMVFQNLVKKIGDYASLGIHPSFASNFAPKKLSEEIMRLSGLLHRQITYSRQHYLMLEFPGTYKELIKNNITHDFTMGFASFPGFRAGIASPYFFYDLEQETMTNLKVFPFVVMDGTLCEYLQLSPGEAMDEIKNLMDEVEKVKGTFIPLWHNQSLCERDQWKGWRKVYEKMLELGAEKSQKQIQKK